MHLAADIDLIVAGVGPRIGGHHQTLTCHNAQAISHRPKSDPKIEIRNTKNLIRISSFGFFIIYHSGIRGTELASTFGLILKHRTRMNPIEKNLITSFLVNSYGRTDRPKMGQARWAFPRNRAYFSSTTIRLRRL